MSLVRFFKVFLLVGMMISLQGCFDYEEILFKGVQNVSVIERNDKEVKIQIDVKVDNPNKFNVKVKKSIMSIYVNEKFVGKTELDEKIVLKKRTEDVYAVVLKADPKELVKAAIGSLGGLLKGNVTVRLKGDVKGSAYGVAKKVPVDIEQVIDLKDIM